MLTAVERSAPESQNQLRQKLREKFTLDTRSLGIFRMVLGLILIYDWISRIPDLSAFYSDQGILPRHALLLKLAGKNYFCLNILSGHWFFQLNLAAIGLACAFGLLFGYRTRLATAFSWILVVSFQVRNPYVNNCGDDVLKMLLFWAMFLPVAECFSVDSYWMPDRPGRFEFFSVASAGLMLQVAFIYWFSALLKDDPAWRSAGTAVLNALSLNYVPTPLGIRLTGFPSLLRALTFLVYYFEKFGPFLAFLPVFNAWGRIIAVFLFCLFHWSIAMTMVIGIFPFACMAGWIAFLPGSFWDEIDRGIDRRIGTLRLFFDGECSACRRGVRLLRSALLLRKVEISEAQSDPKVLPVMQARNSWVLVSSDGQLRTGFKVFVGLSQASPLLWPLAGFFNLRVVRFLGEKFYAWVADHREKIASLMDFFEKAETPKRLVSFRWQSALGAVLVVIFVLNFEGLPNSLNFLEHEKATALFEPLYLDQLWTMFAPHPPDEDAWILPLGITEDQRRIDLNTGEEWIGTQASPDSMGRFGSVHWYNYFFVLGDAKFADFPPLFADYLCRRSDLKHVEVYYVREKFLAGFKKEPIDKKLLARKDCPRG